MTHTAYAHDPLAKKTSWQPLKKTKTPLTNMILKSIEGALEFHLSILSRFLYATLIIVGTMFTLYGTYALLSYHFQATFMSVTLGFILLGIGIYMFSKQDRPLVFDKKKNLYFKETEEDEEKDKMALNDIHALQLISYAYDSQKKAELNLILEDGHRVHVCSSDNAKQIQEDASKIAAYINKPVWNALE